MMKLLKQYQYRMRRATKLNPVSYRDYRADARCKLYAALIEKYGSARVRKHTPKIVKILDRVDQKEKQEKEKQLKSYKVTVTVVPSNLRIAMGETVHTEERVIYGKNKKDAMQRAGLE